MSEFFEPDKQGDNVKQQPLDTSHRIYTMPEQANIDEITQLRQDKAELVAVIENAIADLAPTPKEDCGCESGKCSRCCDCSDCAANRADDVSRNLEHDLRFIALVNVRKES
jgi:hypothetical protein